MENTTNTDIGASAAEHIPFVSYGSELLIEYTEDCTNRLMSTGGFSQEIARDMCLRNINTWMPDFIAASIDNGSELPCPQIIAETVEECRIALRGYINDLEAVQAKYRFSKSRLELLSLADIRDAMRNAKELEESGYGSDYYKYPMEDFTEVKGMGKYVGLWHIPSGTMVFPI